MVLLLKQRSTRYGHLVPLFGTLRLVRDGHGEHLDHAVRAPRPQASIAPTRQVADYADLARLGYVSRARVPQIMNLLNLAPDIREEILFLPRVLSGKDPVTEHEVRSIAGEMDWQVQREIWRRF